MKTKESQKKQFKQLTDKELEQVNGGVPGGVDILVEGLQQKAKPVAEAVKRIIINDAN